MLFSVPYRSLEVCRIGVMLTVPRTSPPKLCKTEQPGNDRCERRRTGPALWRLNFFERWLAKSHAAIVIPLDDCILFVSTLDCAEFSSRLSEVAQTLDAISGSQFLVGGSGLGEWWSLCTV